MLAALGPLLAALGLFWVALGPLLGRSWAALGRSWPLLGRSWVLLASLGSALGPLLAALGAILERHAKIIKNHEKIDAQNDGFWLPKAPPNDTKIAPKSDKKSMQKTKRKKNEIRPSWGRLGVILDRFGSPLGLIFIDFSLVFKAFREDSLFSKNIVSRAVLSPT